MQARAGFEDFFTQGDGIGSRSAAGLGLLAGGVDLDVDRELRERGIGGEKVGAGGVEELGLLKGINAGHAEEVGDLGDGFAMPYREVSSSRVGP
jgi:hypothetical protein